MRSKERLHSDFYSQPTTEVARQLLGKVIVRALENGEELAGIVVETEAYLPFDDPAAIRSAGWDAKMHRCSSKREPCMCTRSMPSTV